MSLTIPGGWPPCKLSPGGLEQDVLSDFSLQKITVLTWRWDAGVRDKKQEDLPGSCDKGGRAVGGAVKGKESLTEAVAKNVGKAMVGKCHSGTI